MNPAFTILMNPHLINNIVYKHKGLQSPTAKIMNDFIRDYDNDLLNVGFDQMMDSEGLSKHIVGCFSKEKLINMIKEGTYYYNNSIAYYTYYFDNREQ
tara:strand:+ start:193 stop:486 length:294 start_codon:yes stop_codon:yes gene_type:complete